MGIRRSSIYHSFIYLVSPSFALTTNIYMAGQAANPRARTWNGLGRELAAPEIGASLLGDTMMMAQLDVSIVNLPWRIFVNGHQKLGI